MGSNGGTRHVYYLTAPQATYVVRLNYIAQPFGIMAVATGKLAVGFLILRLVGSTSKWRKYSLWFLMILTTIISILAAVFTFTQCQVPAALWNPALRQTTHCWEPAVQSNFSIFSASLNSAIDFILALMPISIIWHLQLSLRKRIGVVFLLGCGVLSGVCAAIKTANLVALAARSDLTWETFKLYLWTSSEIFLIIVCGSIPTLRPLWDKIVHGRSRKAPSGSYASGTSSFGARGNKATSK